MMKRKIGQKGATLVELLLSMMLGSMIIAAAGGMFAFTVGVYLDNVILLECRQATQQLVELVKDQILYATSLELSEERLPENEESHEIMFLKNGRVFIDGKPLYSEGYYDNRRFVCKINFYKENEIQTNRLDLTIILENKKKETLYSSRIVVKLMNLSSIKTRLKPESGEGECYLYYRND